MKDLNEMFLKNEETGCLEFTGRLNEKGYGVYGIKKVHRLIWEKINGEIPTGKFVCHKCDNRKCANIEHLFLGDNIDNMKDALNKGRLTNAGLIAMVNGYKLRNKNGEIFSNQTACAKYYNTSKRKIQDMLAGRRNNRFGLEKI